MVFVRKSPGRSGATKVQIAERRAPDSCHRGVSLRGEVEGGEDLLGGRGEWVFGEVVVAGDAHGDLRSGRSALTIFLMLSPVSFCR